MVNMRYLIAGYWTPEKKHLSAIVYAWCSVRKCCRYCWSKASCIFEKILNLRLLQLAFRSWRTKHHANDLLTIFNIFRFSWFIFAVILVGGIGATVGLLFSSDPYNLLLIKGTNACTYPSAGANSIIAYTGYSLLVILQGDIYCLCNRLACSVM